jgi:hypothetical protein
MAELQASQASQPQEALTVPAGHKVVPLDKKLLDAMVNRFLGWRLPDTFGPDCFVSFDRERAKANGSWPIGTNLLTADEARAMLEYVLDATFIPEWSLLEATQASLREHWAIIKELRAQLAAAPTQAQQPAQQTDEQIDALLGDLDEIARAYDHYEYGLPLVAIGPDEEAPIHKMRARVRQWLAAAPQQPAQQAVRVPLTDERLVDLHREHMTAHIGWMAFARAIEAAHGIEMPPAAKEGEKKQ